MDTESLQLLEMAQEVDTATEAAEATTSFSFLGFSIYEIAAVVIVILLLAVVYYRRRKLNNELDLTVKQKKGTKNHLDIVYQFYSKVPLFRKFFSNIKEQVKISYPADEISIRKRVTELLTKVTIVAVIGIIASLVLGSNDIYFLLSGLVVTYVICESMVKTKLQKMQELLLQQFSDALSIMSHYYHEQAIVEDAIYKTVMDVPYEIGLHLNRIHEIVDAPNLEEELNNYIGQEPNKFVLMFLSLCASVKDYGDKTMDNGQSLFIKDLNYLQKELFEELRRIKQTKNAFAALSGISLAALALVKPAEKFGLYFDTAAEGGNIKAYYNSLLGIIVMVGMFVVSIVINRLIVFLRDGDNEATEKDDDIFKRISEIPWIAPWIKKIINKNYSKYKNYDDKERGMGNHTGAAAFLTKQIVIALVTFFGMTALLILSTITIKMSAANDFSSAFSEVRTPNEEYTTSMEETAKDYVKLNKHIAFSELNEDQLTSEIMNGSEITTEKYARNIAQEVIKRINVIQTTYFKWYALVIALVCGVIGFFSPILYLRIKMSVIESRKEEEVVRFQSLMLILMHMGGMTTETILEWLSKFSYCFRESIDTCILNSANGINAAIEDMKDEELFTPFRNFCDNLLLIDKVGVAAAFEEIEVSRENFLENRRITSDQNIKNRSSVASLIAYIPVFLLTIFFILVPMSIMANELMDVFNNFAG